MEISTKRDLFGRRRIYANSDVITADNVVSEVNNALITHMMNVKEEEYLYWYRRGKQPILERVKEIRPEILSKIVENDADEIVTFKDGYFLTKAATYVSRKDDESITDKVKELNEYVMLSGKYEADNDVVDWFHTVGLGVLFVEPNNDPEIPFKAYALDPRSAFVVYSMRPGNKPVMGINITVQAQPTTKGKMVRYFLMVDVFTRTNVFRLKGRPITETELQYTDGYDANVTALTLEVPAESNMIGEIPIIEYSYNKLRMGAFENVILLLDAINDIQSNREDGIAQFIQSLMILYNCELDEGTTANSIRKDGYIALKNSGENKADVKILSEQLDQSQTQVTLNDLREQVFKIAGVPFTKDAGGSTSDTGSAVYLRNGWSTADTCARNTEDEFKKSNAYFDAVILAILKKKKRGYDLKRSDFEIKIVRNDVSNLLVKTQAAMNMKELGFAPALAFERSGLSSDPLNDVEVSKEYIDKAWSAETQQPVTETDFSTVQNATEPQDRVKGGEPNADKG